MPGSVTAEHRSFSADLVKEGLDVGLELGASGLLVVFSEVGLQLPEALQVLPAQRADEPLQLRHSLRVLTVEIKCVVNLIYTKIKS